MSLEELPETDQQFTLQESRTLVNRLSESRIFQDYEKAYSQSSGLPLAIRPIESFQMAMRGKKSENPFCALMARTNKSCIACLEVQAEMEKSTKLEPKSLHCFAGMCDTMVPIRVGDKLIAFLQTGQVLLDEPSDTGFDKITRQLLDWGTSVDLKSLQEAYFQTKVLSPEQYDGFINMLTIFAQHLATIGNSIKIKESAGEPQTVKRARQYIEHNFDKRLSLEEAAKAVNTSVRYFCKVFKKSTSMTFVDYLTRLRIEKSKNLLLNPNKRISEIAYEVGFESLTQFNRSFKKLSGQTPTQYRKTV
ncbi:MAG: AraC-like DNA-binding protein/ligand-binding sensor protein [Candidatus Pelagisphaera sp.]|jgi:AraC-like DNA-binding protein/ligand-binding sensor protein